MKIDIIPKFNDILNFFICLYFLNMLFLIIISFEFFSKILLLKKCSIVLVTYEMIPYMLSLNMRLRLKRFLVNILLFKYSGARFFHIYIRYYKFIIVFVI